MKLLLLKSFTLVLVAGAIVAGTLSSASAAEVLIADRISNAIHRYTVDGDYIATLVSDGVNLNQPAGLQLSPDFRHLYVASSLNSQVVRYDYSYTQGTATNPVVFADASDGLLFPNSILFSEDGNTIYVSDIAGAGVAQFNLDGTVAGPPMLGAIGGTIPLFSGLARGPSGEILVGGHVDPTILDPFASNGAVGRIDAGFTTLSDFIAPSMSLAGVSSLLVDGNDLYVVALYAGTVSRFDATTGALDPTFSISGLGFPAGLMLAPDGNGLLVGVLSDMGGEGAILRYDFSGNFVEEFAPAVMTGGFSEATAMLLVNVPEPATCGFVAMALLPLGYIVRRRLR